MNLYVGNLSATVDRADLLTMFEGLGQVLYAKLAESAAAVNGNGYAFVYVPDAERAHRAVSSLNGKLWKGERLTVHTMVERPGRIGASPKR